MPEDRVQKEGSSFRAPESGVLDDLLPGYEVLDLIACGGMGAVYRARQIALDREVAIKILPPEFGADPKFRAGFEAEAKAMARLNHPNLIAVYDFGEAGEYLYCIMEMVKGKSLYHSAHGKAIAPRRVAHLVLGICEGLAHAHEAGIIHRDIKPGNILLAPSRCPKIGDFGLARSVRTDGSESLPFVTPDYAAPEILRDPGEATKQSDVYSIGVVLSELLTGALPGEEKKAPSHTDGVDAGFDAIVRRAMHPSPAMRYGDARKMAEDLEALLPTLEKDARPHLTTGSRKTIPSLERGRRPVVRREASPAPKLVKAAPAARPVVPVTPAARPKVLTPSPPAAPAVAKPGVVVPQRNWKLYQNLVIIVVLLAAIVGLSIAWDKIQKDRESTAGSKTARAPRESVRFRGRRAQA